eukprot:CAMPEP_0196152552 /NCGR_PEP_ID=MMETSP0910-20130528/35675_1 /TAXON_ID=49265 /ORGANISM="Thalassiosira rotula, Strain GSO102" /LENGTH=177 /DNA_ID=CAMNT_0041416163 /DNA_START=35 /DNA_END=568 /DNA_ORIENTATION=-
MSANVKPASNLDGVFEKQVLEGKYHALPNEDGELPSFSGKKSAILAAKTSTSSSSTSSGSKSSGSKSSGSKSSKSKSSKSKTSKSSSDNYSSSDRDQATPDNRDSLPAGRSSTNTDSTSTRVPVPTPASDGRPSSTSEGPSFSISPANAAPRGPFAMGVYKAFGTIAVIGFGFMQMI